MAYSWEQQIYPAGSQNVTVSIAYLDKSFIYVYLDGMLTTNYTWASDAVIRLDTPLTATTEVLLVRRTEKEYLFIQFAAGVPFISENLDTQNTQFLHLAQEMVEGRAIEGFYGDISMNGYKITNLGRGTEPGDAVNKEQLDEVDTRVTQLEQTFVTPTSSYPWFTNTTVETDVLTPGFTFTKAAVYINGVCQTPGYSYEVVDNIIMLADPVPAGTHIMARLGEDVPNEQGYATTAQLSATNVRVTTLESGLSAESAERAAADATMQADINAKLDATANAVSATKLATARTIQTNLAATTAASFDGSADVYPGVIGTLPVVNGGTGASSAAGARTALGAAMSGVNPDITQLTGLTGGITGTVAGTAAATGIVGEFIGYASPSATNLVSGTLTSIASVSLSAGEWDIEGSLQTVLTGSASALSFGISTSATALPSNWYEQYAITTTVGAGTTVRNGPIRRLRITTATTVYFIANVTFSGTCSASGYIRATRVR